MADPFVAEIRIFPFNFAPKGWAFCNGQLLPISQNTALFSLLGTTYGGDGKSTFALPNLQGSIPVHAGQGQGPGLSQYFPGESGGTPTVSLLTTEIPSHSHGVNADTGAANSPSPQGNVYKEGQIPGTPVTAIASYNTSIAPLVALNPLTVGPGGGGQPHNNMMPTLVLNFCIALQGVFPARP